MYTPGTAADAKYGNWLNKRRRTIMYDIALYAYRGTERIAWFRNESIAVWILLLLPRSHKNKIS